MLTEDVDPCVVEDCVHKDVEFTTVIEIIKFIH